MRGFASVLLAGLLSLACAAEEAGQLDTAAQLIVGGEVDAADPAVVALVRESEFRISVCTATVIAPDVLITAAHCLTGDLGQRHYAYFGTNATGEDPTFIAEIDVQEFAYDARYLPGEAFLGHDIAVVKLEQAAPVEPVTLDRRLPGELYGEPIRIIGFGQNGERSGLGIKRSATTTILDPIEVIGVGTTSVVLYGNSTVTICEGDSGGPGLVADGDTERLVAVASFSTAECTGVAGGVPVAMSIAELVEPFIERGASAFCSADGICGSGCAADPDCAGEVCLTDGACYAPCGANDADCRTADEPPANPPGPADAPPTDSDMGDNAGGCSSTSPWSPGWPATLIVCGLFGLCRRRLAIWG